jgi:hypothetical protein
MALPTSYLTSTKNLEGMLNAIVNARAPEKFTQRFLESLEFKSAGDRLIIGVLKSLDFLSEDGKPTQRYHEYLDQSQSGAVLAAAIKEAYADLFQVNKEANKMELAAIKGKFKTLSQGEYSDTVLDKMAKTFAELCKLADFTATVEQHKRNQNELEEEGEADVQTSANNRNGGVSLGGLVYNIQLVLPDSRDPKVYDALFQSLRKHLQ